MAQTERVRRRLLALVALVLAAAIWLPLVHVFFRPRLDDYFRPQGMPPAARMLAERQLQLWTDPAPYAEELRRMRGTNAEWDFMGRSYVAWGLANLALREPARRDACLEAVDRIIDETVRLEREQGQFYFMMDYARSGEFSFQPARSLFVDGEIALMMAMRRVVAEKDAYRAPMQERIATMVERMRASPVLIGGSYAVARRALPGRASGRCCGATKRTWTRDRWCRCSTRARVRAVWRFSGRRRSATRSTCAGCSRRSTSRRFPSVPATSSSSAPVTKWATRCSSTRRCRGRSGSACSTGRPGASRMEQERNCRESPVPNSRQ